MGDILRRRGMMQEAGASPSGALYQLRQGTISATNYTIEISGNHVTCTETSASSGRVFVNSTIWSEGSATSAYITDSWFTLNSGDTVKLIVKNGAYTNNRSSGSARFQVSLYDTSGTSVCTTGIISLSKTGTTFADKEITKVLEANTTIGSIFLTTQYQAIVNFDIEILVNDIRYI